MTDYDYIIVGAGLAGLALTTSLIDLKFAGRIALIDPRTEYKNDHIWSCWDKVNVNSELPFNRIWNQWKVKHKSKTSTCLTTRYPYSTIFAESYYSRALEKIVQAKGISLFLGETIINVNCSTDEVAVETAERRLTARLLFDSRPPEIDRTQLHQDFFGIVIRSPEKNFDPSCVTLMDFTEKKSEAYGFHFYYVLPFSAQEALVESVFVGFERMPVAEHRLRISQYLEEEFAVSVYEETHIEHGHIPMHEIKKEKTHPRHYFIGTRGGLVRASTGYGLAAIERFSNQLAQSLQREDFPKLPQVYSDKSKILDAALLTFLKRRADLAPGIFGSLFSAVPPDVLVRFLCDFSSPEDDARVFAAMPNKFELGLILAGQAADGSHQKAR